jgi:hypothetical protein
MGQQSLKLHSGDAIVMNFQTTVAAAALYLSAARWRRCHRAPEKKQIDEML